MQCLHPLITRDLTVGLHYILPNCRNSLYFLRPKCHKFMLAIRWDWRNYQGLLYEYITSFSSCICILCNVLTFCQLHNGSILMMLMMMMMMMMMLIGQCSRLVQSEVTLDGTLWERKHIYSPHSKDV